MDNKGNNLTQYDGCDLLCTSPTIMKFNAPYNSSQRRILTLMNLFPKPVLFKVKSNASKQYHVEGCTGRLDPYSSFEVNITLKYFDFDAECQYDHHFRIQSIVCPFSFVQQDNNSILAFFKQIHRSRLSNARIDVFLDANPVSPPAKSPLDSVAMGLRKASQRVIASQVASLVSNRQKETDNEVHLCNRTNITTESLNGSDSLLFSIRTKIRVSLSEFPSMFQCFIFCGAVVAVLVFFVLMNSEDIDGGYGVIY
ncbi:vesicle-associated membrane protein-associated protein A [Drosophila guanche]|uniref:Blast:Vesicle-associated membrane protein-associated protein A n=1 Tax=Drosophila guanche TaxID=7266 RepID=A0A3B0K899_DROGU|nr:vesicle-associated membrane protein-associated protein A [Drosophila guanche]SPP79758.1 blast:Vesicle-associated membrane protein-associated protein A [Drosophila guanche]